MWRYKFVSGVRTKYILLVVWCQFPISPEASFIAVSSSLNTSLSCSSGDLHISSMRGLTMLDISHTFWQYFWIGLGLAVEPSEVKALRCEILSSRVLGEKSSINPVKRCICLRVRIHNSWIPKSIHICWWICSSWVWLYEALELPIEKQNIMCIRVLILTTWLARLKQETQAMYWPIFACALIYHFNLCILIGDSNKCILVQQWQFTVEWVQSWRKGVRYLVEYRMPCSRNVKSTNKPTEN